MATGHTRAATVEDVNVPIYRGFSSGVGRAPLPSAGVRKQSVCGSNPGIPTKSQLTFQLDREISADLCRFLDARFWIEVAGSAGVDKEERDPSSGRRSTPEHLSAPCSVHDEVATEFACLVGAGSN